MLTIKKINEKLNAKGKKRKGSYLMEMAVGLVILAILYSFFSPMVKDYINAADMTKMRNDMKAIGTAAMTYAYWAKDGQPPESIDKLLEGLSAADSKDGQEHTNLLNLETKDMEVLTPWGDSYDYDATAREISCTPRNSAGEELEKVTVTF